MSEVTHFHTNIVFSAMDLNFLSPKPHTDKANTDYIIYYYNLTI